MLFPNLWLSDIHHITQWQRYLIYTFSGLSAVALLGWAYLFPYRAYKSPFKNLPGPESKSLFWGCLKRIIDSPPAVVHGEWIGTYGPTFQYPGILGSKRFFTTDPVALSYILGHAESFPKPEQIRKSMEEILGNGVIIAEGEDHRRQRKVLNPSFSAAAVRDMTTIFYDKANELVGVLNGILEEPAEEPASPDTEAGGRKIDILRYLGQTTLDIIGIAGFGYDFQALSTPNNELAGAYRDMFQATQTLNLMAILRAIVPLFSYIPTKETRTIANSSRVTRRIGRQLIDDKKKAILASNVGGNVEKAQDFGKDLLSILIRANMASDLKADQKLSDEEVLAQITTFMLAGNETSSTALTWVLHCLSQHTDSQDRLRAELKAVQEDRPSMDMLASLPYLDAVVREVLRLLPPVPSTIRTPVKDAVIPLGTPVRGRDGTLMETVKVQKGAIMFIPIMNVNTSPLSWGHDATEYNPDRFEKSNEATASDKVPGVYGNLLTFLGGTRNCIGYKFALTEIKAILFVLIRNFTFEELASKPEIEKKTSMVMRPRVVGQEKMGLQLPLLVKAVVSA